MPGRLRLRDFFDGRKVPPPKGAGPEIEELMREVADMEGPDPEEVVRLCRRGQARVCERIDEIMRDEGRRGE